MLVPCYSDPGPVTGYGTLQVSWTIGGGTNPADCNLPIGGTQFPDHQGTLNQVEVALVANDRAFAQLKGACTDFEVTIPNVPLGGTRAYTIYTELLGPPPEEVGGPNTGDQAVTILPDVTTAVTYDYTLSSIASP